MLQNVLFQHIRRIRGPNSRCWSSKEDKRVIFSGIQPTGCLHLGNYFGAIRTWTELQNSEAKCIFSIVDLHSLTIVHDKKKLEHDTRQMLACLIACGIDPDKSIVFRQSAVLEHAQLGCLTTMPRISAFPQFKEKSASMKEIPLGLFIYPVLQSADILLYKATDVPVGEDQLQHIQLAQHLSGRFNTKFRKVFPYPKTIVSQNSFAARIKSLRIPDKKMSKSEPDSKSRIEFVDTPDDITEKFKKAITDCISAVTFEPQNRPGVSNLILIHSLISGKSIEDIVQEAGHMNTGQYKLVVADAVIEKLNPIRMEINRLLNDKHYLDTVLKSGQDKATEIAMNTMAEVNEAVGIS